MKECCLYDTVSYKECDHDLPCPATKQSTNGYTATALAWQDCMVEAPTREEALAGIESAIRELLNTSEIVEIDVPETPSTEQMTQHKGFGMFRHDPTFAEFVKEVDVYHDERNRITSE